ncbi:MAG: hypothetical protein ACFCVE_15440 [Phycisphaerae bacterium]
MEVTPSQLPQLAGPQAGFGGHAVEHRPRLARQALTHRAGACRGQQAGQLIGQQGAAFVPSVRDGGRLDAQHRPQGRRVARPFVRQQPAAEHLEGRQVVVRRGLAHRPALTAHRRAAALGLLCVGRQWGGAVAEGGQKPRQRLGPHVAGGGEAAAVDDSHRSRVGVAGVGVRSTGVGQVAAVVVGVARQRYGRGQAVRVDDAPAG